MRLTVTKTILLFFTTSLLVLVSCQKEVDFQDGTQGGGSGGGGNSTQNIAGDYDFLGMTAHTVSTVTANVGGDQLKTVTTSDYVTKANTGTVKITSNQFITTNMSYSIDTMMNAKTYINGALFDDSNVPFQANLPPTSSTSDYVRINADSITVTGSFGAPNPSGQAPTGPVGVKLSWSGDTLLMKVNTTITQTIVQQGIPAQLVGTVNGVTKLKKR